jgi:DNA transformation protein
MIKHQYLVQKYSNIGTYALKAKAENYSKNWVRNIRFRMERNVISKDIAHPSKLEDIPNIGKSIACDLRTMGIHYPQQLATNDPLKTYFALADVMGHRHDPCVLYTLMAAKHFLEYGESLPWWKFTLSSEKNCLPIIRKLN